MDIYVIFGDLMKYVLGIIILALGVLIFLSGCITTKNIEEIKFDSYINKNVTVSGTVLNSIKLGELSGYTLKDDTDSIFISSNSLPAENAIVKVNGILKKSILGYYIEEEQ